MPVPREPQREEDPIVQYYVVDAGLGMSPGKLGAQTAHAATLSVIDMERLEQTSPDDVRVQDYASWLNTGMRKIVLRGSHAELAHLEQEGGYAVRDHGHTELEPGSLTVVALWPMRKSVAKPLVKRLQVYKAT